MVVYLDVYFGLNLWMDVVLIGITAAVCGERIKVERLAASACIGAAVACGLLTVNRKWQLPGMVIGVGAMMRVAFPHMKWRRLMRAAAAYIVAAFFAGGVINWWYFEVSAGRRLRASGVAVAGALILVVVAAGIAAHRQRRRRERDTYRVLLKVQGRNIITSGFLDTGNCLRDDCGRPVHICEKKVIFEKDTCVEGSFSVTYNTLSGEGTMEAVCADRLVVPELNVDIEKPVIGLAEEGLFRDGRCHILLNGVLGEGH